MDFAVVTPKHTVHRALRITNENIDEVATSVNGTVEDGVLKFTISNHDLYGIAGDWLVIFGTDVQVYSDKFFQRNYDLSD